MGRIKVMTIMNMVIAMLTVVAGVIYISTLVGGFKLAVVVVGGSWLVKTQISDIALMSSVGAKRGVEETGEEH